MYPFWSVSSDKGLYLNEIKVNQRLKLFKI